MPAELIRIFLLVLISLIYALYDIFNKRNVPDLFVYASLAVGLLSTIAYWSYLSLYSIGIAVVIGAIGYVFYKGGQLGAGDGFELVTISLLLPIQPTPFLTSIAQFGMPFILSVLVATGFAAIVIVPIYYLLIDGKNRRKIGKVDAKSMVKGIIILAIYLILLAMIYLVRYQISLIAIVLILALAVSSMFMALYANEINYRMISFVYPKELERGDMIAVSIMKKSDLAYFTRAYEKFGRVADDQLIAKVKDLNRKLPVYKKAVPFAAFIFIGVVVSLLFGDIFLFIF
ncbi:MAG: hypothetical protein ACP5TK_02285 [Candidatus Micrarchaeia archaeon]